MITHLMNALGGIRMLSPSLMLLPAHYRHKARKEMIMLISVTIVIISADIY